VGLVEEGRPEVRGEEGETKEVTLANAFSRLLASRRTSASHFAKYDTLVYRTARRAKTRPNGCV
jgi:hypothetical protein